MTSQKQIDANRRNARKSTGPKTPEGKRKCAMNGIKHGVYARTVLIDSPHLKESKRKFNHLHRKIRAHMKPADSYQDALVREIANCVWRANRIIRAKTDMTRAIAELFLSCENAPHPTAHHCLIDQLIRFEKHLHHQHTLGCKIFSYVREIQEIGREQADKNLQNAMQTHLQFLETTCHTTPSPETTDKETIVYNNSQPHARVVLNTSVIASTAKQSPTSVIASTAKQSQPYKFTTKSLPLNLNMSNRTQICDANVTPPYNFTTKPLPLNLNMSNRTQTPILSLRGAHATKQSQPYTFTTKPLPLNLNMSNRTQTTPVIASTARQSPPPRKNLQNTKQTHLVIPVAPYPSMKYRANVTIVTIPQKAGNSYFQGLNPARGSPRPAQGRAPPPSLAGYVFSLNKTENIASMAFINFTNRLTNRL